MTPNQRLKLRARDLEDMKVLAACLQDALVPLNALTFLKREGRFLMVANRFCWERGGSDAAGEADAEALAPEDEPGDVSFVESLEGPCFHRVNCGVCFDRVRNVRFRALDLSDRRQILNLLTVEATPQAVTLLFSGGGALRLEVAGITCHLEDLGEPWPTRWRPSHSEAGSADGESPPTDEETEGGVAVTKSAKRGSEPGRGR